MIKKLLLLSLLALASCHSPSRPEETLVAIQIQDRNGLTETINAPDRLETYKQTDFLASHPYKKVLRIYRDNGKNSAQITTYYQNGSIWQYLEVEEMRAHGAYREWHPNGHRKIDAYVVGGTADVSQGSMRDWLFDGISTVWSEEGHLVAEIPYQKGALQGISTYYYPSGQVEKEVPYSKDLLEGFAIEFFPDQTLKAKTSFRKGEKDGLSLGYFSSQEPAWIEEYADGLLVKGAYYSPKGSLLSEVENGRGFQVAFDGETPAQFIEIVRGKPEGIVKKYNTAGELIGFHSMRNGLKHGEEIEYFLPSERSDNTKEPFPKLSVHWNQDLLHGPVKTWYDNGQLRSQREYCRNQLCNTSLAWYRNGSLMFIEEYEENALVKGLYYKMNQTDPISTILNGNGTATLFDEDGTLLRKVPYEKGKPIEP